MQIRRSFVLCGAILSPLLVPCAVALAAPGPKVTVRVEGRTHTLLAPTVAQTHTGSITEGGAPAGACSATSAAGALNDATGQAWAGPYKTSFGDYEVNTILGESHPITSTSAYYWGFWVNDKYLSTGICGTKLHSGDRVLFAADSVKHHEHPIELIAPRSTRAGHAFSVKVEWFSDAGVGKPLAGVHVDVAGTGSVTNSRGTDRFVDSHPGMLVLRAERAGYIRAAPVSVRVSA